MFKFRRLLCLLIFCYISFFHFAVAAKSSSDILLELQKLNTVGSVLFVAAHPDDENTRLLSYLANERKLRTGYLSITRGDGGQNLIGKEQGELLGLIRTQELLAARRTDGAIQFFTNGNDFGYSKSPEETIDFWDHDSTLAEMVWVIRNFKPDVIINRFPSSSEGGHGHHTASAILSLEAFDAAADPQMFPEQLKHTEVWQAKRLFWNTYRFGSNNTTSPDQIKVDVGGFNPLLGKGYGEIASESRSMHKSQGFGAARQRGELIEFFKQLKGDSALNDIFEGIDQSWNRLNNSMDIQLTLNKLLQHFEASNPAASLPELVKLYKQIDALAETDDESAYWKKLKLTETEELILACSGLWLEASADDHSAVPGDVVNISAQIVNRSSVPVTLQRISHPENYDTTTQLSLQENKIYSFNLKQQLSEDIPFSNPYWLNKRHGTGRYKVKDILLMGMPENEASVGVSFDIQLFGLQLSVFRGLSYKSVDPVKGEVYRPFEVLPPATVSMSEKVYVFKGSGSKEVQIRIKAHTDGVKGELFLETGEGWDTEIVEPEFSIDKKGEELIVEVNITADAKAKNDRLKAFLKIGDKTYTQSIKRIEYDHIPYQFALSDAEARLINVDLKLAGTNIGYIPGAGDEVAACLKEVGYKVTELTDEMLASSDLTQFSAIVSGIRAYNVNGNLQAHYPRLMEYVKNGGNLINQYNTNNRIGPLLAEMAPYPFTISRDRVTDETAPVNFVHPGHSVLNYPNKITQNDFEGWVQERGIYFASEFDTQYETLLSMNDPKDEPNEGSLIIATYGEGNYIYTGLAFFRQLPAGVPGAYRLFVNLLSMPQNK